MSPTFSPKSGNNIMSYLDSHRDAMISPRNITSPDAMSPKSNLRLSNLPSPRGKTASMVSSRNTKTTKASTRGVTPNRNSFGGKLMPLKDMVNLIDTKG